MNSLLSNFPNAKIITILQPSSYNRIASSVTTEQSAQAQGFSSLAELQKMNDVQYSNYAMALKENAIEEVARAYQVEVVDCFHEFPTIFNSANRTKYWSTDKLHLSAVGYQFIVDKLEEKIIELFGK